MIRVASLLFASLLFLVYSGPASTQTAERAVIAGTLVEDWNGDGTLAGDGGAVTLVQIMGRDAQGGFVCGQAELSDSEGRFRFDDLPVTDYELWIWWAPGFLDRSQPVVPGDPEGLLVLTITAADLQDGIETVFLRLNQKGDTLAYPVATGYGTSMPVLCEGPAAPVAPENVCLPFLSARAPGQGQAINLGKISFLLPDQGTYAVFVSPPGPAEPTVTICYFEGGASLTLSATDGREIERKVSQPYSPAGAVFFHITETVQVGSEPASPPPGRAGGVIRPPDTGDAGLQQLAQTDLARRERRRHVEIEYGVGVLLVHLDGESLVALEAEGADLLVRAGLYLLDWRNCRAVA